MIKGRIRYHNSLRKHRKIIGYSIKEVALILNIRCAARISRWEQGVAKPNLRNVLRLGLLYHTLVDQLYEEYRNELKEPLFDEEQLFQIAKNKIHAEQQ